MSLIKYEEKIKIVLLFNEGRKIQKVRMYAMWHVPQIQLDMMEIANSVLIIEMYFSCDIKTHKY